MYRVTFVSALFAGDQHDQSRSQEILELWLETLVQTAEKMIRWFDLPRLYESGIRYKPEPLGQENWQDPMVTLKLGTGDCEDLATYRAAELRVRDKVPARCIYTWRRLPNGVVMYHIKVEYTDAAGRRIEEDPSRRLGMAAAA